MLYSGAFELGLYVGSGVFVGGLAGMLLGGLAGMLLGAPLRERKLSSPGAEFGVGSGSDVVGTDDEQQSLEPP